MNVHSSTSAPAFPAHEKKPPLSILLIGGTGFVGSQLAPILRGRGHDVVLASRNSDTGRGIVGRDGWTAAVADADVVVMLSVINNDVDAPIEEVRAVNVELPLELAALVAGSPRKRLVLFGSDHADTASDAYSSSKAELIERLNVQPDAAVTTLILSPVHGTAFVKKLAFVDRLPGPLRSIAVAAFGALRPLSHVGHIADAIEAGPVPAARAPVFRRVVDDQDRNFFYRSATRLFDLAFAGAVIVFFGWLMAILFLMVAASTPGPALFKQQRVGRNGKVFTCFKFRTMRIDTPQVATHQVSADSTTPIGKHLRDLKLDELPQVFNILANHMSLVGPRPCLPTQHELVEARRRLGVLAVKPGVTGWSQIRGIDMSDPQKLAQADAEYCARRSIPLYIRIAMLTFLGKGQGDRIR